MRQLVRLLLVIPIALVLSSMASMLFLMIATVVSPAVSAMVFGAMQAFMDAVMGLAFEGDDPGPLAAEATMRGARLAAAIILVPVLLTALISELFRVSSALMLMVLAGCIAVVLPAALIGLSRLPTSNEAHVLAALFLTGCVSGAVYWLIAGRGAAKPAITAPSPSAGS